MSTWFVIDQGKKSGPFQTSDIVRKVVSRQVSAGALVWKDGMPDWQPLLVHFKTPPVANVRDAASAPEANDCASPGPDETASASTAAQPMPTRKAHFLRRYWQGLVPLPVSYWIVGFLGNFIVLALILSLRWALNRNEYDPTAIIAALAGSWLIALTWGIYQFVGIWRAAGRYRQDKRARHASGAWGLLAQFAVIAGSLALAAAFALAGAPQLLESWKIAVQGDPDTPAYTLRVMRNGTELEIAGGLKYGLARDVEKVLAASPQVQVVHLNSIGGRVGEAEKLARIIRARNLVTYTSASCLSACTIAFRAGRERWLSSKAQLGYHGGSFAGRDYPEIMRNALLRAGYDASFVTRAASYPSSQMWYPTVEELKNAKVISGTSDTYRFAISGYGMKPGAEDFARALRNHSLFKTIEQVAPDVFRQMADEMKRGYVQGVPEGQLFDKVRGSYVVPLVVARLVSADDRTVIDYAALLADQYDALGSRDAKLCYAYATKGATTTIVNLLPADLRAREVALTERALTTRRNGPGPPPKQLAQTYTRVAEKLIARFGADNVALLDAPRVAPAQYAMYCRVLAEMLREIHRLPVAEAGDAMRDIFGSGQAKPSNK